MKIGVLSDSHGHQARTAAAVAMLRDYDIACVLHCGDVGSAEVIGLLALWPGHFVGGNIDEGQDATLQRAMSHIQRWHGLFADLELAGRRIAIVHGHDRKRLDATIAGGAFDLVCYGHTHKHQQRRVGRTQVLNPGALYRTSAPTCAVVDLRTLEVQLLRISS